MFFCCCCFIKARVVPRDFWIPRFLMTVSSRVNTVTTWLPFLKCWNQWAQSIGTSFVWYIMCTDLLIFSIIGNLGRIHLQHTRIAVAFACCSVGCKWIHHWFDKTLSSADSDKRDDSPNVIHRACSLISISGWLAELLRVVFSVLMQDWSMF